MQPQYLTSRYIRTSNRRARTGLTIPEPTPASIRSSNLFWSPYNWFSDGSNSDTFNNINSDATYAVSNTPGAYFKTRFTGTSFSIVVDVSAMVTAGTAASNYPVIEHSVNGGAWTRTVLTNLSSTIALATGLTDGPIHSIEVVFAGVVLATGDRWNTPINAVKITDIILSAGGLLHAPVLRPKRAMFFGDSYSEGFEVLGAGTTVANQNARLAWPSLLASYLNAEFGIAGFSSQGYTVGVAGVNLPDAEDTWDFYSNAKSRLRNGLLQGVDYVVNGHGTNDTDSAALRLSIEATSREILNALPSGAALFVINNPTNGKRTTILSAVENVNRRSCIFVPTNTNYMVGGNISGSHLSTVGQVAYADGIWALLQGLLPTPSAPVNTVLPTFTGMGVAGVVHVANTGSWSGFPEPTFTYQWRVDGVDISGATSQSYTPSLSQDGSLISVRVTATNGSGTSSVESAAQTITTTGFVLVTETTKQGTTVNPSNVTTDAVDTTEADLLVACVSFFKAAEPPPSISDNKGNTWTLLDNQISATGGNNVAIYWSKPTSVGTNHTITVNGTALYPTIWFASFKNSAASPAGVFSSATSASASSLQPGSITPTKNGSLIITAVCYGTTAGITANALGFNTGCIGHFGNSGLSLGYGYQRQSIAAPINPTWTWTPSQSNVVAVVGAFTVI